MKKIFLSHRNSREETDVKMEQQRFAKIIGNILTRSAEFHGRQGRLGGLRKCILNRL